MNKKHLIILLSIIFSPLILIVGCFLVLLGLLALMYGFIFSILGFIPFIIFIIPFLFTGLLNKKTVIVAGIYALLFGGVFFLYIGNKGVYSIELLMFSLVVAFIYSYTSHLITVCFDLLKYIKTDVKKYETLTLLLAFLINVSISATMLVFVSNTAILRLSAFAIAILPSLIPTLISLIIIGKKTVLYHKNLLNQKITNIEKTQKPENNIKCARKIDI